MLMLLWLVPVLPLLGYLLLTLMGSRLSRARIAVVGVGSVGLSAALTLLIGLAFIVSPPPDHIYVQTLWSWIKVGGFEPNFALHLDPLSLVMTLVVTFVGFLIHLYSAEFMIEEQDYGRFFAYMNLFVGSMLTLLLADNLLLLYMGWEAVGLCSYLLIGFWYQDPANGRAARKAFVVTRIGDTAMAIGLFLLFDNLGTLQIQELMQRAVQQWPVGSGLAVAAAAMLLGGAVGKSAQLPLQIWLPDAMAGPTPVSALIHAATMVTAGVYLIARTHVLFSLAPTIQSAVAIIGTLTLLLAAFSALTQKDIKRVLAYSTMSQIGYMFLALGVGAWSAALFHFMTHAFFKALLFLGAGVVIIRLDHEHDMFKMGGLRKELPITFWSFLVGAASLSALPLVTAGFYSKDLILWNAWSAEAGSLWLWAGGLFGALLTSMYTFRMVFLTFFGQPGSLVKEFTPLPRPGRRLLIPLVVLAFLSVVGGLVELPQTMGGLSLFSDFLGTVLPAPTKVRAAVGSELALQILAAVASLGGIVVAYWLFLRRSQRVERLARTPVGGALYRLWFAGWGFDWLDNELFVRPFLWVARKDQNDVIDRFYDGIARLSVVLHQALSRTQTGQIRRYAAGIVVGGIVVIGMVVLL
jgi:NADH-quinone oxidoreductase subunit L